MQQRSAFNDHVLGYRIEHILQVDSEGVVFSQFYRVIIPDSDHVLGEYAQRAPAFRAIVARELASCQSAAA